MFLLDLEVGMLETVERKDERTGIKSQRGTCLLDLNLFLLGVGGGNVC